MVPFTSLLAGTLALATLALLPGTNARQTNPSTVNAKRHEAAKRWSESARRGGQPRRAESKNITFTNPRASGASILHVRDVAFPGGRVGGARGADASDGVVQSSGSTGRRFPRSISTSARRGPGYCRSAVRRTRRARCVPLFSFVLSCHCWAEAARV